MKHEDVQLIGEIRQYLDDHLYGDHPIAELCRRFNINRNKLQAGFLQLVRFSVHAYIIRRRLERAARRLLESDESIKTIALESGYKKPRSFAKTFKRIYNLTPASYRLIHRQTPTLSGRDGPDDTIH